MSRYRQCCRRILPTGLTGTADRVGRYVPTASGSTYQPPPKVRTNCRRKYVPTDRESTYQPTPEVRPTDRESTYQSTPEVRPTDRESTYQSTPEVLPTDHAGTIHYKIMPPFQGLQMGGASVSTGCASLHPRLCTSRPCGTARQNKCRRCRGVARNAPTIARTIAATTAHCKGKARLAPTGYTGSGNERLLIFNHNMIILNS
jgi:hypothetical protein